MTFYFYTQQDLRLNIVFVTILLLPFCLLFPSKLATGQSILIHHHDWKMFMQNLKAFHIRRAQWGTSAKNRDVSTGPLACHFAHSLTLLTRLICTACFACVLCCAHSQLAGKWVIWCIKTTWFGPIVPPSKNPATFKTRMRKASR